MHRASRFIIEPDDHITDIFLIPDTDIKDIQTTQPTEYSEIYGHLKIISSSTDINDFIKPPYDIKPPDIPSHDAVNVNRCSFCLTNKFIFRTSAIKFINKCIAKFYMNKLKFLNKSNKDVNMLISIISLDNYAASYLYDINNELYHSIASDIRVFPTDTYEFIINGIIHQYNQRKYIGDFKIKKTYDEWLISNNIRCESCDHMACQFHHDYGSWESIVINNNKKKYCCGWCVEYFDQRAPSDDSMEIISNPLSTHIFV